MNKPLVVLCGLAIGVLLTGCTSTPAAPVITVEDQAKLIEYDNCLKIISSGVKISDINFNIEKVIIMNKM
jgi:hypothetical protein